MLDECVVARPGDPVTDPETGNVTEASVPVYTGRCKVQQTISQASSPNAGEHSYTVQDSRVDFPVSAGPFAVSDAVTITGSELDPQLVGVTFRISELFHKSYATAQRTRVEEVVA